LLWIYSSVLGQSSQDTEGTWEQMVTAFKAQCDLKCTSIHRLRSSRRLSVSYIMSYMRENYVTNVILLPTCRQKTLFCDGRRWKLDRESLRRMSEIQAPLASCRINDILSEEILRASFEEHAKLEWRAPGIEGRVCRFCRQIVQYSTSMGMNRNWR
jgi:Ser/Thr protein kinase RdoA (MazF antagonist)